MTCETIMIEKEGVEITLTPEDSTFTTPKDVDTSVGVFTTLGPFAPEYISIVYILESGEWKQVLQGDTWKANRMYGGGGVNKKFTFTLPV